MNKLKIACGFCNKSITTNDRFGFITFPDKTTKPVHMSHYIQEEYRKQHRMTILEEKKNA